MQGAVHQTYGIADRIDPRSRKSPRGYIQLAFERTIAIVACQPSHTRMGLHRSGVGPLHIHPVLQFTIEYKYVVVVYAARGEITEGVALIEPEIAIAIGETELEHGHRVERARVGGESLIHELDHWLIGVIGARDAARSPEQGRKRQDEDEAWHRHKIRQLRPAMPPTRPAAIESLRQSVFALREHDDPAFDRTAIALFRLHGRHNPVYREFIGHLGVNERSVRSVNQIPFLPIGFFKRHRVGIFDESDAEAIFKSSGTTGNTQSYHHVADLSVYQQSLYEGFVRAYGDPADYRILALLPSYLGREGSSLVYMMHQLMRASGHGQNGFFMDRLPTLAKILARPDPQGRNTLLVGVTFALLDLAERHPQLLKDTIVMETGGMKGRRRELPRSEVHSTLMSAFGVEAVHSEYGMTELLSQAYSKGKGIFACPPWMRVVLRELNDPLTPASGRTGAINVIDLANMWSCPFIATDDLGRMHAGGDFEVLGRADNTDVRGCNLMVEELT